MYNVDQRSDRYNSKYHRMIRYQVFRRKNDDSQDYRN
ncbi:hypothetical protein CLOL250_01525 [Clostridium sp. L2-50]|nr:hypothetical protein CLOL250_01525 [Clostridium sp. L2-50]